MNNSTLIATGNFNFKQIGMVRGSQYRCKGACQEMFQVPGVYSELSGQDAQKFVNALGQKHRRTCNCVKEESNNVQAVVAVEETYEPTPKPSRNLLTLEVSEWDETDIREHLEYHGAQHELQDPISMEARLPECQFGNPKILCVWEHDGSVTQNIQVSSTLLYMTFPHMHSRFKQCIDDAKVARADRARERVVHDLVEGAVRNILRKARESDKPSTRPSWAYPMAPLKLSIKKSKSAKTLAQVRLMKKIDAYRASENRNDIADEMMNAALAFV